MEYFARLEKQLPYIVFERDFSFARHTTIGCGGTALLAAYPKDGESLALLLKTLAQENVPYCFLGAGANVLPSDGVFEGVVVRFSNLSALSADGTRIFAGAGVTAGALCRFARENGLSGFEPFTGIPSTVGGGITMNAGVAEGHFSDLVEEVVGVVDGELVHFTAKDCAFSEKTSVFQSGIAVVQAVLVGEECPQAEILRRTRYFREKRKHLPKGRSMGCTFVNPAGVSAGKLIEECGLKGVCLGGARVSEKHANFILNEDGSASDVSALIAFVSGEVERKTGIRLREEIRRIP